MKYFNSLLLLTVIISFLLSSCNTGEPYSKYIDADHPYISYTGRFDKSDKKNYQFDFPATYIEMRFTGKSIAIRMNDTANYYQVVLDNYKVFTLPPKTDTLLKVGAKLKDTIHTIKVLKRTEASVGVGQFKGFVVDSDAEILSIDKKAKRKIEFIGNSITCGYGNEALAKDKFKASTENSYYSYASFLARKFDADYTLIAYSGKGLVRNYNDKRKESETPIPAIYNRVLVSDPNSKWNFKQWAPDLVVINLGTNDFSTKPHPDSTNFAKSYENFVNRIRMNYPPVKIICICGPLIGDPCCSQIKAFVQQYRKEYGCKNIYALSLPKSVLEWPKDLGADEHPNVVGHKKIADYLKAGIAKIMNWDE